MVCRATGKHIGKTSVTTELDTMSILHTDDNLSWVLTGFDWSQLSQQPMTTGWIWSGCRLLDFCKKTNRLRFWLCPNGVKNQTQLDLKPLGTECDQENIEAMRMVHRSAMMRQQE
jgi:hypothetical protein